MSSTPITVQTRVSPDVSHLSLQIKPKLCRGSWNDGRVLDPLGHHEVLQLLQVFFVHRVLLRPLVVDVCEVVGALQELLIVEWIVPILGRRDQVWEDEKELAVCLVSFTGTLYPGDVGPLRQESPDQLTQEGGARGTLARGNSEHSLVRGAEGDEVPDGRRGTPLQQTSEQQPALRDS